MKKSKFCGDQVFYFLGGGFFIFVNSGNERQISFLNIDSKILSKAILIKLKAILPTLISSQQTTYVKNRFIGESGRLICDIIKIRGWFNIKALTPLTPRIFLAPSWDNLDLAKILSHG